MNIELLLGKPLAEIQRMTDKELEEYFGPCLNITRPNLALQARVAKRVNSKTTVMSPHRKMAMQMLAGMGIDLEDL